MLECGIIEKFIDSYTYKVRIPFYDQISGSASAQALDDLVSATVCTFPGFEPHYDLGETVWLAFLHESMEDPVIIGKFYTADNTINSTTYLNDNCTFSEFSVSSDTSSVNSQNISEQAITKLETATISEFFISLPKGLVFKQSTDILLIKIDRLIQNIINNSNLTYKWAIFDSTVTVESPDYDVDFGVSWKKLVDTELVTGTTGNVLDITNKLFQDIGIISCIITDKDSSSVTYNMLRHFTITLINLTSGVDFYLNGDLLKFTINSTGLSLHSSNINDSPATVESDDIAATNRFYISEKSVILLWQLESVDYLACFWIEE